MTTVAHSAASKSRPTNRVYTSVNRPLTLLGVERRLFFLALATSVATFNLFGSLLGGLVMFGLLYALGFWASKNDPEILRIALSSARQHVLYDPHKQASREKAR